MAMLLTSLCRQRLIRPGLWYSWLVHILGKKDWSSLLLNRLKLGLMKLHTSMWKMCILWSRNLMWRHLVGDMLLGLTSLQ